ncbi:hypothetical protein ABEF95_010386 [Exophiala dermatitidis]
MEGRCQCGSVHFTTPLPQPLKIFICHCLECRRQSASAFGITAIFPAFELEQSQSKTHSHSTNASGGGACATQSSSSGTEEAQEQAKAQTKDNENSIGIYEHNNTKSGRTKKCYFCKNCGTRLMHGGGPYVAVKGGCLEALSRDMLDSAMHIWTKRAVVPIPEGVLAFPEDPV